MKFKLTVVFLFVSFLTQAQFRIEGKVIDSVTEKPLVGVNVFLSHTTTGMNSAENGDFLLSNIKEGKYDLVVSSLNYEDYIMPISIKQFNERLLIKMKPTANILKEVIVESYDPKGWSKWGEQFKENFIGSSQLAKNCVLLNPDVVKFKFNSKTNRLRVFSNEKLIFENRNLGYKIHYLLTKFELDFNTKSFSFKGYPLFEELKPSKSKEANKWVQARNETFKGSMRHFIRSLYADQLVQDGFEMRQVLVISKEEKNRSTKLLQLIQEKADKGDSSILKIEKDSLDYYNSVSNIPYGLNKVTLSNLVSRNSIVTNTNSTTDSTVKVLYFEGILQVMFINKKLPYEYIRLVSNFNVNDKIRTDIYLRPDKSIYIYQNGSFYSGLDLFTDGYWSWSEKVATMIPSDYVLPVK